MGFLAGKYGNAAIAAAIWAACVLSFSPGNASEIATEHASRLSQLVDRLQTGSISPQTRDQAQAGGGAHDPCGAAAATQDHDLLNNAKSLDGLCIETVSFTENDVAWKLQRISSGRPGPLWTVFHDDGDAAFSAAIYGVKYYGGILIAIEAGEHALHAGLDPESLFVTGGTQESPARSWPRYAALFMYEAFKAPAVISLRSSTVLAPGKTANLVMAGVDSRVVEDIREDRPSPARELQLTWLDGENAAGISSFTGRLLAHRSLPYFRIEASGETLSAPRAMIDMVASAAKLPKMESSKHHYSVEGKLETN